MRRRFILQVIVALVVNATVLTGLYHLYPKFVTNFPLPTMMLSIATATLVSTSVIPIRMKSALGEMEKCQLRKEYGMSYCAKCPDGYECAKRM